MPITSFSAQQAAETLKLSYSQLNRLSNTMLNMPFKQYILHEKIKAAPIILGTSPSCSVKDAAHAVGIEDAHYFSRLFRKYMGCSCMEYQNTHLGFWPVFSSERYVRADGTTAVEKEPDHRFPLSHDHRLSRWS